MNFNVLSRPVPVKKPLTRPSQLLSGDYLGKWDRSYWKTITLMYADSYMIALNDMLDAAKDASERKAIGRAIYKVLSKHDRVIARAFEQHDAKRYQALAARLPLPSDDHTNVVALRGLKLSAA